MLKLRSMQKALMSAPRPISMRQSADRREVQALITHDQNRRRRISFSRVTCASPEHGVVDMSRSW